MNDFINFHDKKAIPCGIQIYKIQISIRNNKLTKYISFYAIGNKWEAHDMMSIIIINIYFALEKVKYFEVKRIFLNEHKLKNGIFYRKYDEMSM